MPYLRRLSFQLDSHSLSSSSQCHGSLALPLRLIRQTCRRCALLTLRSPCSLTNVRVGSSRTKLGGFKSSLLCVCSQCAQYLQVVTVTISVDIRVHTAPRILVPPGPQLLYVSARSTVLGRINYAYPPSSESAVPHSCTKHKGRRRSNTTAVENIITIISSVDHHLQNDACTGTALRVCVQGTPLTRRNWSSSSR